jgi:hypothetical protein
LTPLETNYYYKIMANKTINQLPSASSIGSSDITLLFQGGTTKQIPVTALVGATGAQGVIGNTGAQGVIGNTGAQGVIGANGVTGPQGVSVTLQGTIALIADLDTVVNPQPGDAWTVTESNGGDLYFRTSDAQWDNVGKIVGPQGAIGPIGPTGNTGIQGVTGNAGIQGIQGPAGSGGGEVASVAGLVGEITGAALKTALAISNVTDTALDLKADQSTTFTKAETTSAIDDVKIMQTGPNGALYIPSGQTSERPTGPDISFRFNTTLQSLEFFNGTAWSQSFLAPANATYLVVAGGAGGGGGNSSFGGGGGGGGGGASGGSFALTPGVQYTIVVGAGGAGGGGSLNLSANGSNSLVTGGSLSAIQILGGGNGASYNNSYNASGSGGTGGGGGGTTTGTNYSGADGTTGQGFAGARGNGLCAGGGGGSGGPGQISVSSNSGPAGAGGPGLLNSITGLSENYAGGGGGGGWATGNILGGTGGAGGGAEGGSFISGRPENNGTINTGGGGGGKGRDSIGGAGGSGVVFFSVPTASFSNVYTGSPVITVSGQNTVIKFVSSGTYTAG